MNGNGDDNGNGNGNGPPSKYQFLVNQLKSSPQDSKKWKMSIIGLKGIGIGFFVGTAMVLFRPEQAGQMTTMVQVAMTAWGGIIGIYLGAQGSVDFKSTAALQNTQEAKQEIENVHQVQEVHTINQGDPGAPEVKPWGAPAAQT